MTTNKMKIRKGDMVRVLTGKDRGKEGEVMFALPDERKVIVAGVNIAKKHQRPPCRSWGPSSRSGARGRPGAGP